jgi:hypothetical protein
MDRDREGKILEKIIWDMSGAGCLVVDCNCGRTHFADGEGYEEGMLEWFLQQHEKKPGKFIFHRDEEAVSVRNFFNKEYVMGCPCNWVSVFAGLLVHNRDTVVKFYREYEKELKKEYDDLHEKLGNLEVRVQAGENG